MVVLQDRFRVSQRRACRLTGQHRNTQRRPVPLADIEEQKLRSRIRELARRHVRWGRRLVYRRLRLDGWSINHKRVQRIWRKEGLQRPLSRRRKRSRPTGGGRELLRSEYPHHVWAIDFQFDQTMDGRTLKFLNVIDEFSRVCLAIRVGRRCKAVDVIDFLEATMLSFFVAVILVILLVFSIKSARKKAVNEVSVDGIFARTKNMLYDEEIQNRNLDDNLQSILRQNEFRRARSPSYGFSPNDPIRVNGPLGEQLYIAMLRGMDGQAVIGHRLGSLQQLDVYEVATSDFTQWAVLVFDMYYLSKDTVAPAGFTIDPSGIRTLTAANRFMAYFPSNFYSELIDAVSEQIGFPLVNTLLGNIQSNGVTRPAAHQELMNQIVVLSRAEGIGMDS